MEDLLFAWLAKQAAHGGGAVEKIVAFVVCWTFVKRGMRDHLKKIESGLDTLAEALKTFGNTLKTIEQDHSNRLDQLESGMNQLIDIQSKKKPEEAT